MAFLLVVALPNTTYHGQPVARTEKEQTPRERCFLARSLRWPPPTLRWLRRLLIWYLHT